MFSQPFLHRRFHCPSTTSRKEGPSFVLNILRMRDSQSQSRLFFGKLAISTAWNALPVMALSFTEFPLLLRGSFFTTLSNTIFYYFLILFFFSLTLIHYYIDQFNLLKGRIFILFYFLIYFIMLSCMHFCKLSQILFRMRQVKKKRELYKICVSIQCL